MRISGTSGGVGAGKVGKAGAKSSAGKSNFSSKVGGSDKAGSAPATSEVEIVAVQSLLFAQEIGDDQSAPQEAVERGHNILAYLDKIRLGLLEGTIPKDVLLGLEERIKNWRKNFKDPELNEILNEIELRAAVELAKLNK
ncbi:hypothetical protein N9W34_05970 [Rickettsiales bacterium]|nr:hypothetical protein [Rickettsiales bacterium]